MRTSPRYRVVGWDKWAAGRAVRDVEEVESSRFRRRTWRKIGQAVARMLADGAVKVDVYTYAVDVKEDT